MLFLGAVGDVAVYLAVENPRIRPDQAGLRGVIGSRANAVDPSRWDDTARSLRTTATEISYRQLLDHRRDSDVSQVIRHRPGWLTEHLHTLAEHGALAELDLDRYSALVGDIHNWRVEHDLIDHTEAPDALGPIPNDPLQRARRTQLERRLAPPATPSTSRGIR